MKSINEEFTYYLTEEDNNREVLFGLKQYFSEYIANNSNDMPNSSKFINSKIIGTLMFELLQNSNIEYEEKTKENINYFKFYLDKCIENKEFCDNKIFLPCIQECINLTLPKRDLKIENFYTTEQIYDYNVIHADFNNKTNIIYNNKDKIKYSKIYYCKNIEDLFVCSLYELFEKKYTIRKCVNCNRYFVTKEKGNRIKYCYNNSPQNPSKSCYEYYSQLKSKETRKNNDIINLYYHITNRLRTRMEREEDECVKNLYNDELFQLSRDYDSLKKELKDGKISKQDLMKFLMDYDKEDKKNWRKKYVNPRNNKK